MLSLFEIAAMMLALSALFWLDEPRIPEIATYDRPIGDGACRITCIVGT